MKKLLLAAIFVAVMLTGCDSGQVGSSVYPRITKYGEKINGYFYAVDERTGVVYLAFDGIYRRAMTVAQNADGTPVTKEQLEAWRSDDERTD